MNLKRYPFGRVVPHWSYLVQCRIGRDKSYLTVQRHFRAEDADACYRRLVKKNPKLVYRIVKRFVGESPTRSHVLKTNAVKG